MLFGTVVFAMFSGFYFWWPKVRVRQVGLIGYERLLGVPAWSSPVRLHGEALMQLALQFLGALGILAAFALLQSGCTTTRSWPYLALNFAGAAILTWLAVIEAQWGFVILQGIWALAAAPGPAAEMEAPHPRYDRV